MQTHIFHQGWFAARPPLLRRLGKAVRRMGLVLTLATAALVLIAPAGASLDGTYRFSGHMTTEPEVVSWPRYERISGGRIVMTGEPYRVCYRAVVVDPAHDYISGCWNYRAERMIYPDGTQDVWGESTVQDLAAFPGDEGGWKATFTGDWGRGHPPARATFHVSAEGWGALQGWHLEHQCSMPRDREPCIAEWHYAEK